MPWSLSSASIQTNVVLKSYNRSLDEPTFSRAFSASPNWFWHSQWYKNQARRMRPTEGINSSADHKRKNKAENTTSKTGFQRFLPSNFKYCLTLFSKLFSPFDHSTCSLSVSCQYLALDEIYHPLRAQISMYSTLWQQVISVELRVKDGILTLYDPLFQRS